MPARNYSGRTREEYASDLGDLTIFLESRKLASWLVVGLRDLQLYMAELDRRGLEPASRNRKTYAIKTFFTFQAQSGYLRENPAIQLIPPKPRHRVRPARRLGTVALPANAPRPVPESPSGTSATLRPAGWPKLDYRLGWTWRHLRGWSGCVLTP